MIKLDQAQQNSMTVNVSLSVHERLSVGATALPS